MKQLATIIKNNSFFYSVCMLFFAFSGVLLLNTTKAESFIFLNNFHSSYLTTFFVNYTFLGDGLFCLSLFAFLLYRKQKKLALLILFSYLFSGLVTQVLKNIIYAPRPRIFFEASQYLLQLDSFGNSGGGASSFPSGHTTSAFALATILALYFRKNSLSVLLFLGALLVGYSRIYLAQHFPVDVIVGALIGVGFATISLGLYNSKSKLLPRLRKLAKQSAAPVPEWRSEQLPQHTITY